MSHIVVLAELNTRYPFFHCDRFFNSQFREACSGSLKWGNQQGKVTHGGHCVVPPGSTESKGELTKGKSWSKPISLPVKGLGSPLGKSLSPGYHAGLREGLRVTRQPSALGI